VTKRQSKRSGRPSALPASCGRNPDRAFQDEQILRGLIDFVVVKDAPSRNKGGLPVKFKKQRTISELTSIV
jgi:hypothetical protein